MHLKKQWNKNKINGIKTETIVLVRNECKKKKTIILMNRNADIINM